MEPLLNLVLVGERGSQVPLEGRKGQASYLLLGDIDGQPDGGLKRSLHQSILRIPEPERMPVLVQHHRQKIVAGERVVINGGRCVDIPAIARSIIIDVNYGACDLCKPSVSKVDNG